ncbi:MAG: DUF4932 domain-containing protein, partial [Planctomycetota bacterium]|nr:DUF4932 domain-containing protein [Planctomycetota bacterium]
ALAATALICVASLWSGASAQMPAVALPGTQPMPDRAPAAAPDPAPLAAAVDTRVELMCIIARLAGCREYTMPSSRSLYSERVDKHFGPFREHTAIKLFRDGRRDFGWSYDAVPSLALHLTAVPELAERMDFEKEPARLDARWRLLQTRAFLATLRDFAQVSDAKSFFDSEADLYKVAAERLEALGRTVNPVGWFDEFFGIRQGATYRMIPGLLCGGQNFGVGVIFQEDHPEEICPVLGCQLWDEKGLPIFDEKQYTSLLVHELCHSYTNAYADRHEKAFLPAMEVLTKPVEEKMRKMAYATPRSVLYESLVRASVICFVRDRLGESAAAAERKRQSDASFLWVPGLSEVLERYAHDRTACPTFDDAARRIAEYLNQEAAKLGR